MADDLHFQTISELSRQIAARDLSPVELTRMYLERVETIDQPDFELPTEPLRDPGGKLASVITLARERALREAETAEREIRSGRNRGPLHGIPYGVKDLLDTAAVRTTWGSRIFANNVPDRDATVVKHLTDAGAVLMAKMAQGEFAGGNTSNALNPWKLDRTSFGSSSGTVVATVAGLIGFGIGTETGGSIVYPASAVGATGLRPTYGRVSRSGCMALSWSLDKIGPVGRCAEDCGIILEAIAGRDPKDPSTGDKPFRFNRDAGSMRGRKIGVHRAEFDLVKSETNQRAFTQSLDVLAQLGAELEDFSMPPRPIGALFSIIVATEAGASFKHLFDDRRIGGMFRYNWLRRAGWMAGRMAPAGDYLQAQRIRQILIEEADETLSKYDVIVAPTWPNGAALKEVEDGWPIPAHPELEPDSSMGTVPRANSMANMAGLPGIAVPCGFDHEGMPLSLHVIGSAWDEQKVLDIAMAYQKETDWHLRRPPYPFRK